MCVCVCLCVCVGLQPVVDPTALNGPTPDVSFLGGSLALVPHGSQELSDAFNQEHDSDKEDSGTHTHTAAQPAAQHAAQHAGLSLLGYA